MTPNKEDYIKTIYKLGGKDELQRIKPSTKCWTTASTTDVEQAWSMMVRSHHIRWQGAN